MGDASKDAVRTDIQVLAIIGRFHSVSCDVRQEVVREAQQNSMTREVWDSWRQGSGPQTMEDAVRAVCVADARSHLHPDAWATLIWLHTAAVPVVDRLCKIAEYVATEYPEIVPEALRKDEWTVSKDDAMLSSVLEVVATLFSQTRGEDQKRRFVRCLQEALHPGVAVILGRDHNGTPGVRLTEATLAA